MRKAVVSLGLVVGMSVLGGSPGSAQTTPEASLTRFDCGTPQAPVDVNTRFSDTYAYAGLKLQLVYSCYLVKHGDEYMMWDTGQSMSAGPVAPRVGLADLLAQMKV